jgi:hypothetical protein
MPEDHQSRNRRSTVPEEVKSRQRFARTDGRTVIPSSVSDGLNVGCRGKTDIAGLEATYIGTFF